MNGHPSTGSGQASDLLKTELGLQDHFALYVLGSGPVVPLYYTIGETTGPDPAIPGSQMALEPMTADSGVSRGTGIVLPPAGLFRAVFRDEEVVQKGLSLGKGE